MTSSGLNSLCLVRRAEVHQVADIHLFVPVVDSAQIGFAHVFELVQVEVVTPQFRTVHLSVENMTVFLVDQLLDLDLALVDLRLVDAHFLDQLLQSGGGFLWPGDLAPLFADFGRKNAALDLARLALAVFASAQTENQILDAFDLPFLGNERLSAGVLASESNIELKIFRSITTSV